MDNIELVISLSLYSLLFLFVFILTNNSLYTDLELAKKHVDLIKIKNYENLILEDCRYGYVKGINLLNENLEKYVKIGKEEYIEINGSYGFGRLIYRQKYSYIILGR